MELFAYLKRAPSPGTYVRYLVNTDDPDTAFIIQGHVLVFTESNWDIGVQVTAKGVYQTDYQHNMTEYLYDENGTQILDRYVVRVLLHSLPPQHTPPYLMNLYLNPCFFFISSAMVTMKSNRKKDSRTLQHSSSSSCAFWTHQTRNFLGTSTTQLNRFTTCRPLIM